MLGTNSLLLGRYLYGNPITNLSRSNSQANFLSTLKNLTSDDRSLNTDCKRIEQRDILGKTSCVFPDELVNDSSGNSGSTTPTPAPIGDTGSSNLGLIVGVSAGAILLILLVAYVFFRVRRLEKGKHTATSIATTLGTTMDYLSTMSPWKDSELLAVQLNFKDIEDIQQIGYGAFATVWFVRYRGSQLLASKRLKYDGPAKREQTQKSVEEIKIVANLQYPKIVSFIGAAWTVESDLQALFEYMEGGDLRTYLENRWMAREWTSKKVQIAIDIVEALVYVHSFVPPLVHRDLKSRNVLLSEHLEAKLTDFGVSRFQSEQNTMIAGVGTGRWLAPEVITDANDYGPSADIFSFGAVLTELDTHALPYEDAVGPYGNKLGDITRLPMVATDQVRPNFSNSCPIKIMELGKRCLSLDPSARSTAAKVAYGLRMYKKRLIVKLQSCGDSCESVAEICAGALNYEIV